MEEQQLLLQLQKHETREQAFRHLVSIYQKRLYLHIRSMVFNHEDTDDVLQNTFIKVYQNIHSFKGESQLFSWMYRIATNEALTHLKKQSRLKKLSLSEYNETQIDNLKADSLFDGDEAYLKLQKAVANLPEKQQLVFKMRYFEELDYKSIAEILGTSVGGLKASYHHAVKKIELYLESN